MRLCYSMSMLNLSTSSFDWALKQAERLGDTNRIFPMPFEFSAIRHDWCRMVSLLSSKDVLNWEVRPGRECLSPNPPMETEGRREDSGRG